jgi:hypothetical protein
MTRIHSGWSNLACIGPKQEGQVIDGSDTAQSLRQTARHSYRQKLGWDLRHEFRLGNNHKGKAEHETGWMKGECP